MAEVGDGKFAIASLKVLMSQMLPRPSPRPGTEHRPRPGPRPHRPRRLARPPRGMGTLAISWNFISARTPRRTHSSRKSPFALLVGMVLDQQVPLEWAFASPWSSSAAWARPSTPSASPRWTPKRWRRRSRPGRPSTATRARWRRGSRSWPSSSSSATAGRTEGIWEGAASGDELLRRVKELPGFGEQKAKIFVALLGKQLGVRPDGWDAVSTPFSERGSFRSVADITDVETLNKVRAFKQALKAANKAKALERGRPRSRRPGPRPARRRPARRQQDRAKSARQERTPATRTRSKRRPAEPARCEVERRGAVNAPARDARPPAPLPLHGRPSRPRLVPGRLHRGRRRRRPAPGQGPRGAPRSSSGAGWRHACAPSTACPSS